MNCRRGRQLFVGKLCPRATEKLDVAVMNGRYYSYIRVFFFRAWCTSEVGERKREDTPMKRSGREFVETERERTRLPLETKKIKIKMSRREVPIFKKRYWYSILKKGTPSPMEKSSGKKKGKTEHSSSLPFFVHASRENIMDRGRMNTSTLDRVSRLASTAGDKESIDVSLAAIEWDIKLVDGGEAPACAVL